MAKKPKIKKHKPVARRVSAAPETTSAKTESPRKQSGGDVGYWTIIRDSLKFSMSFDKIFAVYIILLPVFLLLIWLGWALLSLGNSLPKLAEPAIDPAILSVIAGPLVALVGYAIISLFLQTLVRVGITENAGAYASGKRKSLLQSIKDSHSRFWPALGAILLVALILGITSGILVKIPVVGDALSNIANIVLSLMLFLVLPSLVLAGNGIVNSFRESYHIFIRKPLDVILMALAIIAVELFLVTIIAIVALPFAWSFIMKIAPLAASGAAIDPFVVIAALKENFVMLSAGLLVIGIIWAFLSVFADAVKALFYLRIKKI